MGMFLGLKESLRPQKPESGIQINKKHVFEHTAFPNISSISNALGGERMTAKKKDRVVSV